MSALAPHHRPRSEALPAFLLDLEGTLAAWAECADEKHIDPLWAVARAHQRDFTLRPAKRVRPTLVAMGFLAAHGQNAPEAVPEGVVQFAAGLELLHTFMLVHDDVADRAATRRGLPSLHRLLGDGRDGEDLAVVLGDHLYARSLEAMLTAKSRHAARAVRYVLEICRHTAAGQHLDLVLSKAPLRDVTLFRTLKVADLKTARYGFVAPLACGAMLANADAATLEVLKRIGRHAGLAYQLRDDLIGLFGDDAVAGKDGGGDYLEGKRTFPLIAAWTRADAAGQRELEALWEDRSPARLEAARAAVEKFGGRSATQRVIDARSRAARKALEALPDGPMAKVLDGLLDRLSRRSS